MTGQAKSKKQKRSVQHRLDRKRAESLKPAVEGNGSNAIRGMKPQTVVDCGWGRLLFAQTFPDQETLVSVLKSERSDKRDIAFYIRDPHVALATAPQEVFLDPSHTYRLDLATYRTAKRLPKGFFIRRLCSESDAEAVNKIYLAHNMVPVEPRYFWQQRDSRTLTFLVAEDEKTGEIIGAVTGVDHSKAFKDPERGSSLWCLAVDAKSQHPGLGEALVRRLAETFQARGAAYMDLSVLHDNQAAIKLYEKLGFKRVSFFTLKRKNPINEKLFVGEGPEVDLNPYGRIIVDEARRRGIGVDILDAEGGFFQLSYGGRRITCRESLSELTSAIALSRCDDKSVTRRIMIKANVPVPRQVNDEDREGVLALLNETGSVVVKPARGEQGRGVFVGIETEDELDVALDNAHEVDSTVLVEEHVKGEDLRVVVIGDEVVAAALRKPPEITGDGKSSIEKLIKRLSRRRENSTGGESTIPFDDETERCVRRAGYKFEDVLESGETLQVRRTANLHTGGVLVDVTDELHPDIADSAIRACRAINIPVCGIDFIVTSPGEPDHVFIEANERPGLANHEPQPTAEKFINLLFPLSKPIRSDTTEANT